MKEIKEKKKEKKRKKKLTIGRRIIAAVNDAASAFKC
jgi:hypothetical protein